MKTVVAVVCVVLLCAAELAQSQGVPRCSQLIQQTKDTLYHNLPRNSQTSEMVEQKCVTRIGRVRVFYSCGKDASAVLTDAQGNTREFSPDTRIVNLRKGRLILECLPLPPSAQPPVAPVEEGETRVQMTGCPSIAPNSKLSFHFASNLSVCERSCTFKTSTYGLSQERVRTYYTCCSGDVPTLFIKALKNFYVCPLRPGKPEEPSAEIPLPPVDPVNIIKPLLPEISRPVPVVTNAPPAEISGPSAEIPACSSVSVRPTSEGSFLSGSGRVCKRKCTFKKNTHGLVQELENSYYTCCSGDVPTRFGSVRPPIYVCTS